MTGMTGMTSMTRKNRNIVKDRGQILEPCNVEPCNVEPCNVEPCNEVKLRGRVSSTALEKVLPSGDKVVEFRIVVDRNLGKSKKREVDTLDVAAWTSSSRRKAASLKENVWVEVHGAVRRRFWQAPSGLASRWQVEAHEIHRL